MVLLSIAMLLEDGLEADEYSAAWALLLTERETGEETTFSRLELQSLRRLRELEGSLRAKAILFISAAVC